jgi:hypothetical protein
MTRVMIVSVGEDLNLALVNLPQNFNPLRKFTTSVNNNLIPSLRPLLNSFPVAEPTDIGEVARNGVELVKDLSWPGHPRLVYEGQSNTAVTQRLHDLRHESILVSDFDGKFLALGEFLHEGNEPSEKVIHTNKCLLVEIAELK